MNNMWNLDHGTMEWVDGSQASYSIRIDQEKLGRLIRRAARNKKGKATCGPITVNAVWTKKPEVSHE